MSDMIECKQIQNVVIQENGIIRNSKGYLIGRLSGVDLDSEHINDSDGTADCMKCISSSIQKDDAYAYSWHANIAMMCYDAISSKTYDAPYGFDHELAHKIGNEAASRFMKICFDAETSLHMLTK